jgi:biotin transport system substrate-specific component
MYRVTVREMSLVALFPAMMAATAGISIPLGNLPPVSLQTIFVFLSALLLGPKLGSLSMIIYVVMGMIGLPIFSGYRGGLDVLVGQSGGFIIGFVFSACFIGFMKNIKFLNKKKWYIFVVLLFGNAVIYMSGAAYISYLLNTNILLTLATFSPYIIGDLLKILVVIYVYSRIRMHLTYEGT